MFPRAAPASPPLPLQGRTIGEQAVQYRLQRATGRHKAINAITALSHEVSTVLFEQVVRPRVACCSGFHFLGQLLIALLGSARVCCCPGGLYAGCILLAYCFSSSFRRAANSTRLPTSA